MTYLGSIDGGQRAEIFFNDFAGELCLSHMDPFHRLAMVSTTRRGCLNALTKVVLYPTNDERGMIDGIYLSSR